MAEAEAPAEDVDAADYGDADGDEEEEEEEGRDEGRSRKSAKTREKQQYPRACPTSLSSRGW